MSHSLVIPSRTTSRHSQISPSKSKINLFQQVTIKPSSNETTSSVTACRLSATYPSVSLLSSDSLLPHFLIVVSVVSRVVHGAHHHSPKMLKLETIVLALELSAYAHTAKGSSEPLTSKGGTSNDHLQVSESGLAHGSLRTLATRTLDSVSWILSLSILIDVNGYDGRKRTHVLIKFPGSKFHSSHRAKATNGTLTTKFCRDKDAATHWNSPKYGRTIQ